MTREEYINALEETRLILQNINHGYTKEEILSFMGILAILCIVEISTAKDSIIPSLVVGFGTTLITAGIIKTEGFKFIKNNQKEIKKINIAMEFINSLTKEEEQKYLVKSHYKK